MRQRVVENQLGATKTENHHCCGKRNFTLVSSTNPLCTRSGYSATSCCCRNAIVILHSSERRPARLQSSGLAGSPAVQVPPYAVTMEAAVSRKHACRCSA